MTTWGGALVARMRRLVIETYGTTCWLCHQPIDITLPASHPRGLTLDHVLPRSRGGSHTIDNLRPAHRRCNLSRGANLASARRTRIENPASFL